MTLTKSGGRHAWVCSAISNALRAILADEVLSRPDLAASCRTALSRRQITAALPVPIPERLRQLLREHSFGTPYLRKTLDPLVEMAVTWVGAEFDFEDALPQEAATRLRDANRSLIALVNERIYVTDLNPEMGWSKTDYDVSHGVQKGTLEAIEELNARAEALCNAIDAFEKVGRARIRVAARAVRSRSPAYC
jgi:hypothetical protein